MRITLASALATAVATASALPSVEIQAASWIDEEVTVSRSDIDGIGDDEARMYLMPGQQVSVRELVRGLIVASANDAALVLAKRVGSTSAGFEQLMNQTAISLGMTRTRFTTPSGITTPWNYSTARDLAILSIHLTVDFPEYYAYSSAQHFAFGTFHKRNKNWLLGMDPSVDGLKTGHTREAGSCIAATAKRKQVDPPMTRRVFAVILGAANANERISGAKQLLDYAFSAFKDYRVSDDVGSRVTTRTSEVKSGKA